MRHIGIGIIAVFALGAAAWVWQDSAPAAAAVDVEPGGSIQAAIDRLPAAGGVVRIPPGEYVITEPIVLNRPDTQLIGSGAATHIVNKNENGKAALILGPADYEANSQSRVWRIQVRDLRISGNPNSGDGVLARGVNELFLHGVGVDHNGGHGVSLIDCYEDPRVCDCILTYNADAGLNILRGHDIVVNGNQFEENRDALRCIDSFNLCMNGNNLDDHLRHGVVIENTYGSVVAGNMIEECQGTAVVMDRDCYGNTVSANVIAHEFGGGIDLRDAWGCAVSANTFTIVEKFGIRVGPDSGRITISANSFSDSYIGGKTRRDEGEARGIVLTGTSDIAVTGNVFTGLNGPPIAADGDCERVIVSGNVGAAE